LFDPASYRWLNDNHRQDLAAAIESSKVVAPVLSDSGVDLVQELDGRVVLYQLKRYAGRPRRVTGRARRRRARLMGRLMLAAAAVAAAALLLGPNRPWTSVLGTAAVAVMAVIELGIGAERKHRAKRKRADWPLARFSARSLTNLAALLAGRRRLALRAEWRSHLAGESGHDPVTWRKIREALGFVASAVQYRLADAADAAWTPVDAVLKSRALSNLLVFGPTATAALFILRHEGTLGVVTSAESISAIGGVLYGLVRVGRWWRDVKPPEPKARRVKE
jgi:sugar phosphate isomerase/epimerase